ncbi:MAG: endonuclease/exonuclease/phosphatase family protein [Planctomycetes bacterium]|nr:endonuclease/exonuclease/phosphatase family protein [Planctomycetota bacterium]
MKIPYNLLTIVFLAASVPLAWLMLQRDSAAPVKVVRFASFNVSLHRKQAGQLLAELESGDSEQAGRIAEIVQRIAPDVLLLCEVDRDDAERAAEVFAERYLAVGRNGQQGIDFPFRYCGPVNTGVASGLDLDGDGRSDGPGDAWGYGAHPGQYGMVVLSRHPILVDRVRTFQKLRWQRMPDNSRPPGFWPDATWEQLRLSSKSHWDVPIGIGQVERGHVIHLLCSHPTPPAFDGDEDRNGRRNHDEIRFWVDYLTPGRGDWIVDDDGLAGGLASDASFVIAGDLNCDPVDGGSRSEALRALLAHQRVQDPRPRSDGADLAAKREWGSNATHKGDAALDTGDFGDEPGKGPGNLRVDYVLPSADLAVQASGVFWPPPHDPAARLLSASDHRLVWVDVRTN